MTCETINQTKMLREYAPSALGDSADEIKKASGDSEPVISHVEFLGLNPMSFMCGTVVV